MRRSRRRGATIAVGALLSMTLVADVAAVVLGHLSRPLRPPIGAAGVGEGSLPVVLVAGVASRGDGFRRLITALEAAGTPVLDFNPKVPGPQPFTFVPDGPDEHVPDIAGRALPLAIKDALTRGGYNPERQHLDVVAHSVGGLLARFLVERVPGWAARVDDLVMVATPNHGSSFGSRLAASKHHDEWNGVAADFRPGSPFLADLGTAEPAGEVYTTIGGEAWPLNWLRADLDGDGHAHGHDGVVPAESPAMAGASLAIEPRSHGKLLPERRVIERITATLRATA